MFDNLLKKPDLMEFQYPPLSDCCNCNRTHHNLPASVEWTSRLSSHEVSYYKDMHDDRTVLSRSHRRSSDSLFGYFDSI